jgi:hypothetical protein
MRRLLERQASSPENGSPTDSEGLVPQKAPGDCMDVRSGAKVFEGRSVRMLQFPSAKEVPPPFQVVLSVRREELDRVLALL